MIQKNGLGFIEASAGFHLLAIVETCQNDCYCSDFYLPRFIVLANLGYNFYLHLYLNHFFYIPSNFLYIPNSSKTVTKRKAVIPAASAGRHSKCSKPNAAKEVFVWKPKEWKEEDRLNQDVTILMKISDQKRKVVEKVLLVDPGHTDHLSIEIQALDKLPDCNRIVKPLQYARNDQDPQYGRVIYEHYPFGDLDQWRAREFWAKNFKPVPESYIWRLVLQMAQALALLQNRIGPDREAGKILLHRDIKPENILGVDNGTIYLSFKLRDFGVAGVYRKSDALKPIYCGTFKYPVQDPDDYETEVLAANGFHPNSSQIYPSPEDYYAARAPWIVTPINLSEDQQRRRRIGPMPYDGHESYNPQYNDELNKWMKLCLNKSPSKRPTVDRLIIDMSVTAKEMLRKMGGKAALVDLDVDFGMHA